ncbi:MAG: ClbS/DfsB family four-helix bundle protein [Anaerolineae bacterium]|nr:ClbS/DfsB family four-helix bundle protein [Anaerolineae bacterium]
MAVKAITLDLLARAHQEKLAFIDRLPPAERDATGEENAWVAKDIVAHCVAWDAHMMDVKELLERGETPPNTDDYHAQNAVFFRTYRDTPWADIRRLLEDTHARTLAYVQAASEDDLTDPARSPWQNNRPAWERVLGNAVTHPMLHLGQYDAEHGRVDHATGVQEAIVERLLALDDSPNWRGTTIYNLACFYALAGQKAIAIEKLGEALRLRPDLAEWSKEDSDLNAIRDEPGYKALYA